MKPRIIDAARTLRGLAKPEGALRALAPAARRHRLRPRGRILAMAEACVPLAQTGAVEATQLALQRAGLGVGDIERFNVNGSSIALGHPMGATGAMLVSCLLDEMERRALRLGVVAIAGAQCVATAAVIERVAETGKD